MLKPIYPGILYDRADLATAAKTRNNAAGVNVVYGITAATLAGPLAGLVAKFSGDYESDYALTGKPAGIYAYNYDRGDLLPSPGKSLVGKCPFYISGGFETDIYIDGTYTVGEWLYVDPTYSCLTNVKPSQTSGSYINYAIGYVVKSAEDGWLGFNLIHPQIIAS